ncbi:MAG TPA: serine hydrolase domain-containing protein [Pyrinomonadaceae bacterium]|jgi:CubicO group peptidase (beta-lactamase class C family)
MKNSDINQLLQTRIEAGDFPSAVYLAAEKGEIVLHDALGLAVVEPEKHEAQKDTIYDLASLTKALVTGLLCAKLIELGEILLSDKIAKYFAEFDTNEKREITIENLLVHTSGFSNWKPFYLNAERRMQRAEVILRKIIAEPLANPVNSKVVYSDLNFLMLGFLIEKLYGKSLDKIAGREIFAPLELQNTFFNPPKSLLEKIAASEKGNEFEKNTCREMFPEIRIPDSAFRNYQIWGEVHDGNCYFMKGVSGHAGLFSAAGDVFKIALQFLPRTTKILKPETCALFRKNFTKNLNEARSIAFQLAETPDSAAGACLSNDSFGHLGFTGTSLWIEPETERIFILLTNRTHARELPFVLLNSTRRKFHALATEVLNEL